MSAHHARRLRGFRNRAEEREWINAAVFRQKPGETYGAFLDRAFFHAMLYGTAMMEYKIERFL